MRIRVLALCVLLTTGNVHAQIEQPVSSMGSEPPSSSAGNELPNIGTPADSIWTQDEEYQIGRMVVKGLRDAGQILDDPEVTEYLQTVGSRLASHAQTNGQRFQFFAVKSSEINAFALPGGFIGVNAGLLLATKNESELAGVLAHEIAHVTQRHIARSVRAQGKSTMVSAAAMLAAILLGAVTGSGDAIMGGVMAAQGLSAQQQINFTRANESEADRVGIGTLAAAGFDPNGVPDFFETLGRHAGVDTGEIPELLRSHPLTSNRVAEARDRVREVRGSTRVTDTISYQISMQRLRVLSTPEGSNARAYYDTAFADAPATSEDSRRYGRALSMMSAGTPEEAIPILKKLVERRDNIIQYRSLLAQAQMQAGHQKESLAIFAHAYSLFPRNIPLTMRYAEALVRADQARRAHEILLDLFNTVPPTPEQARFIAFAANTAGDVADSYSYMAEYYVMSGELMLAINQLQMALEVPRISEVQRARFQARLDQLREYLPKKGLQFVERQRPDRGDDDSRLSPFRNHLQ